MPTQPSVVWECQERSLGSLLLLTRMPTKLGPTHPVSWGLHRADGSTLMRHISAVLAMPSRSHGKPWASRDWRGLEELTHQLRQLCLCPLGVVQRVQPLMGPDGLSLVCEHGSTSPTALTQ